MSKYLLSHKNIDEFVIEWEKQHDKAEQKESLVSFISKKSAKHMLLSLKADKSVEDIGLSQKDFDKIMVELD